MSSGSGVRKGVGCGGGGGFEYQDRISNFYIFFWVNYLFTIQERIEGTDRTYLEFRSVAPIVPC